MNYTKHGRGVPQVPEILVNQGCFARRLAARARHKLADAIPSGASTLPRMLALVTLDGGCDLEAAVGSRVERQSPWVHRRSPGCSPRGGWDIPVGRRGRHRCASRRQEWLCTRIGDEWFTWFRTRSSKSRLNFLDPFRAGYIDFVLNDAAYNSMRNNGQAAAERARHPGHKCVTDQVARTRYWCLTIENSARTDQDRTFH